MVLDSLAVLKGSGLDFASHNNQALNPKKVFGLFVFLFPFLWGMKVLGFQVWGWGVGLGGGGGGF